MARIRLEFPTPICFQHQLSVRISDLNYGAHLGHDQLVSLVHEARAQWFRSAGHHELDIEGVGIVVAELAVNYQAEAFFEDQINIELSVGEAGSKSVEIYYRLRRVQDDVVIAIAKTGVVFFDFQQRCAVPMPAAFRAMLA